jgi:hypothetical protein
MIDTALINWACLVASIECQIKVEILQLAQVFWNERLFPRVAG